MVVALHNLLEPGRAWWGADRGVRLLPAVRRLDGRLRLRLLLEELAGQEFTRKQFVAMTGDMAGAVERVAGAATAAETATREAADTASARAQQEATEGRTCANRPASTPGEGPLMRSRFAFVDRARSLSAELRQNWIDPIAGPGCHVAPAGGRAVAWRRAGFRKNAKRR